MQIKIRNARDEIIATIQINNGKIEEEKCEGCYVSDIDTNKDGETIYRVDLTERTELLEEFSNKELLEEISSRMHS